MTVSPTGINCLKWLLILPLMGLLFVACGMGNKTKVVRPEKLAEVKTVAIWPMTVVPEDYRIAGETMAEKRQAIGEMPELRDLTVDISMFAERLLVSLLDDAHLFEVVEPESVVRAVAPDDAEGFRLGRYEWRTHKDSVDVDFVMVPDIIYKKGRGGKFALVTLSIFDRRTQELVVEVVYDSKAGARYENPSELKSEVPKNIEGVVKRLEKAWEKVK